MLLKYIGKGAFGKVIMVQHAVTEKLYAIKVFRKSLLKKKKDYFRKEGGGMGVKNALEDVMKEIAIMKKIDHPNVLKLFEVIDDKEDDKLIMVIEFAKVGEIMTWDEDSYVFKPNKKQSIEGT